MPLRGVLARAFPTPTEPMQPFEPFKKNGSRVRVSRLHFFCRVALSFVTERRAKASALPYGVAVTSATAPNTPPYAGSALGSGNAQGSCVDLINTHVDVSHLFTEDDTLSTLACSPHVALRPSVYCII